MERMGKENKKLNEENDRLKNNAMEDMRVQTELEEEIKKLKEENEKLKKENFVMKDRLKFGYKGVTREEIDKAEKENRKLKLHIEAKDKAYTALLKDYEEIKEDRDRMKEEIEQRLNAFRNR